MSFSIFWMNMASNQEQIAIIGIGCKLPGGVDSPDSFWDFLASGRDAVTEIPAERWSLESHYDKDPEYPLKQSVRHGAFVDDIDKFDASFFSITPREAICMDPQQRMMLEVTWRAMEDANIPLEQFKSKSVGVFVGTSSNDYGSLLWANEKGYALPNNEPFVLPGNTGCITANRISYIFDLKGPSFTVDTACSSSLVAVHLACQSLLRGESDMALVGGVQVLVHPGVQALFCKAGLLSPDGRCKSFDARANGYVRSEGAGVVLLKPLSKAIQDNDQIYSVILGSAVNSDGRSNGMVAPNYRSQVECVRSAFKSAGVSPSATQYVEAHGTGTRQGDPIELRALGTVLGDGRSDDSFCRVGSVKTNLGHSETAAGITGLIKAALSIHRRQIPPSLHFEVPNPSIDFEALKLKVQTALEPFPHPDADTIVGVSSFGFGGTNAHVVMKQAPDPTRHIPRYGSTLPQNILTLSAKTPVALQRMATDLKSYIMDNPDLSLNDICSSANRYRSTFKEKSAIVASSTGKLVQSLHEVASGDISSAGVFRGSGSKKPGRLAWLITGQGSQYPGMARELYESHPTFQEAFEEVASFLNPQLDCSLQDFIRAETNDQDINNAIAQTVYTQPLIFAVGYALSQLWHSWGLKPDIVMGHSVGEILSAHLAGVFDLKDACTLVLCRSRLMNALPQGGGMSAFLVSPERLRPLLDSEPEVSIAAYNGPSNTVLAGPVSALQRVTDSAEAEGIEVRPLSVSHAFHTPAMRPMLAEFERIISDIRFLPPSKQLISNVSGDIAGSEVATPEYWCRHIISPVRFYQSFQTLLDQEVKYVVELGARPTLIGMARPWVETDLRLLPSLHPSQSNFSTILQALGQLYCDGFPVDWTAFYSHFPAPPIRLPGYPMERQKYWWPLHQENVETSSEWSNFIRTLRSSDEISTISSHSLQVTTTTPELSLTRLDVPSAANFLVIDLDSKLQPDLEDHCIRSYQVFPAAGFICLLVEALQMLHPEKDWYHLKDFYIQHPLKLSNSLTRLSLEESPSENGYHRLSINSKVLHSELPEWTLHGEVMARAENDEPPSPLFDLQEFSQSTNVHDVDLPNYYSILAQFGLVYGPTFRAITELRCTSTRACARLTRPSLGHDRGLLDSCFQVVAALLQADAQSGQLFLPVGFSKFLSQPLPLPDEFSCQVQLLESSDPAFVECDLVLYSNERIIATIEQFKLRRLPRIALDWMFPLKEDDREQEPSPEDLLLTTQWENLDLDELTHKPLDGLLVLTDAGSHRTNRLQNFAEQYDCSLQHTSLHDVLSQNSQYIESSVNTVIWPEIDDFASPEQILDASSLVFQFYQQLSTLQPRPVILILEGEGPLQSCLASMTKTVQQEYPKWPLTVLYLPSEPSLHPAPTQWLKIFDAAVEECLLRWNGEMLQASRIQRLNTIERYRYSIESPGNLDTLVRSPLPKRNLAAGEVEVSVEVTGLNFRDVLNALGLLRAYSAQLGFDESAEIPFGGECVGRIVDVGPGVDASLIGQRVIAALSIGSLATHVVARADLCVPLPARLDPSTAASVSTAYLTSIHGLINLAKLKSGETVLIHAAAGGVGQAALQVALEVGARVFATASSKKQSALLEQGALHVFDSRTTDFADQILELTDGKGVDVVLNSLKGEWVDASFKALATGGRFVELGKIETWSRTKAASERPDAAYLPFDLLDVAAAQPALVRSMLVELLAKLDQKTYKPIPITEFEVDKTIDAFRLMAQARHVGKVLISQPLKPDPIVINPDATYCISGALGGIGLQLMTWLSQQGARHFLGFSRSASTPSSEARTVIESLEKQGVDCRLVSLDLSDWSNPDQASAKIASLFAELPPDRPLHGVFHCAGIVDDGLIVNQSLDRYHRVYSPKVLGWNILAKAVHKYRDSLLESSSSLPWQPFRVAFSSISALLGSPGQSTYSAANGALDGYCESSVVNSPTVDPSNPFGFNLSIQWGPWAGEGMAGALGQREQQRLESLGIHFLEPRTAFDCLLYLLRRGSSGTVSVANNEWDKIARQAGDRLSRQLTYLARAVDDSGESSAVSDARSNIIQSLSQYDLEDRQNQLTSILRKRLARVMGLEDDTSIDVSESLFHLGLDSLMAVELASIVESELGVRLTFESLAGEPSLEFLSTLILADLGLSGNAVQSILDLGKEAELPSEWKVMTSPSRRSQEDIHNVLLTGSTGFLGAYLLDGQLRSSPARTVYCLVRSDSKEAAISKISQNLSKYNLWHNEYEPRIVPILGDLAQPLLGLDESTFQTLSQSIDGILHNGAQLSQMATYSQLSKTNVQGTKEIIRLALAKCLPIQMISSVAALEATAYRDKLILESDDISEWQGIVNGYSQTKWVSERMIFNASKLGIPITVYRPPLIGGDSQSGLWHKDDLLYRLLDGCLQLGSVPNLEWEIDLVPVDYVANAVTELAWNPVALNKTYHLQHPQPILLYDLIELMNAFGQPLKQLPMSEWIAAIAEEPSHPLNAMLPFFTKTWGDDQLTYPELNQKGVRARPSADYTTQVLNSLGVYCPGYDSLAGPYASALLPVLTGSK